MSFLGICGYYRIPIDATTAKKGKWYRGPGAKLFKAFKDAPIVAEDLGIVTDLVRSELDKTGYTGMKILQHAFDGDPDNEHKPSNYTKNMVAYTGTHDNETLVERIHRLGKEELRKAQRLREKRETVNCIKKWTLMEFILKSISAIHLRMAHFKG